MPSSSSEKCLPSLPARWTVRLVQCFCKSTAMDCPVCFDNNRLMRTLSCNHAMCVDCLRRICCHDTFFRCPMCRTTHVNGGTLFGELREKMCEDSMCDEEMCAAIRFIGDKISSTRHGRATILCRAVSQRLTRAVALLAVDAARIDDTDDDEYTPLLYACEDVAMTRQLLDAGANVNLRASEGWTALMIAAAESTDNSETLKLFLDHGAKVDTRNDAGATALIVATGQGHIEHVRLLVARGSDVNITEENGMSSLHFACTDDASAKARILLEANACTRSRSSEGYDALFYACYNGAHSCVKLLTQHGAPVSGLPNDEWTPLTIAAQHGYYRCAKTLLAAKADLDAKVCDPDEGEGWTALMAATINGNAICASELVRSGACVDARSEDGRTALFLACASGSTRIVRSLLHAKADATLARGNITCIEVASDACANLLKRCSL